MCDFISLRRLFHCAPNVPHYAKNKAVGVMKAGHCFTIEPMINIGVWGDQTWPDNWTSVTQVRQLSLSSQSPHHPHISGRQPVSPV